MKKMNATLYGQVNKPALAFMGSWDPILPEHIQLVKRMVNEASSKGFAPLLIMLDPAPAAFLMKENPEEWVVYNETEVRVHNLLKHGLSGVLCIHFEKKHLAYGAAEMFATICHHVELAEFWFGAKQTFGRGPAGSQPVTIRLARERNIRLYRLADLGVLEKGGNVRNHLANGAPATATLQAQYPPIRTRPLNNELHLPWHPGKYQVLPITDLNQVNHISLCNDAKLNIILRPETDSTSLTEWPDPKINYLVFVSGPQDLAVAAD